MEIAPASELGEGLQRLPLEEAGEITSSTWPARHWKELGTGWRDGPDARHVRALILTTPTPTTSPRERIRARALPVSVTSTMPRSPAAR